MYHKYKRRKKQKPYVYIDITPNSEGMLDCYVFNAPLMKYISVVGIFKDPRLLCNFNDCIDTSGDNISWLEEEIQKRVVELKIRLYRLLQAPVLPNTLTPEV